MAKGDVQVKIGLNGYSLKQLQIIRDGIDQLTDRLTDLHENCCYECGGRLGDTVHERSLKDNRKAVLRRCMDCGETYSRVIKE